MAYTFIHRNKAKAKKQAKNMFTIIYPRGYIPKKHISAAERYSPNQAIEKQIKINLFISQFYVYFLACYRVEEILQLMQIL